MQQGSGFKRQVVFRIGTEDWPLLERAVDQFGSIQAAVVAGLRELASVPEGSVQDAGAEPSQKPSSRRAEGKSARPKTSRSPEPSTHEEIPAREAAEILGLKSGTVRGYIRSGRLAGRYDAEPTWLGWLTTRGAVEEYERARVG
jgi:hypothetical protein